jgi:hypothetical protein
MAEVMNCGVRAALGPMRSCQAAGRTPGAEHGVPCRSRSRWQRRSSLMPSRAAADLNWRAQPQDGGGSSVPTCQRTATTSTACANAPCPVGHGGEDRVHLRAGGEDQVPACTRPGRPSSRSGTRWPAARRCPGRSTSTRCRYTCRGPGPAALQPRGCDQVSAIWARPRGSVIQVKQFPSLMKRIPASCAAQATYSWPLRMTCAPNGGCPDILITR